MLFGCHPVTVYELLRLHDEQSVGDAHIRVQPR